MTIGFVKDGNLHYLKYSKHKNFSYSIHSSVLESDFKCRVFCILLNLHCFLFSVFCFLFSAFCFLLSVSLFLFFFFSLVIRCPILFSSTSCTVDIGFPRQYFAEADKPFAEMETEITRFCS